MRRAVSTVVMSVGWQVRRALFLLVCLTVLVGGSAKSLYAQGTSAAINGQITDSQGRSVPGVEVQAVNIDTNVVYPGKTNDSGIYVIPSVPPGRYRLVVLRDGFKEINKTGLVLHVQDTLQQNFALEVGSISESVTVEGGGLVINTTDGSVSTVVDRNFVENIPLNGRSFQSLITLVPGVLVVPSRGLGVGGEFSVNGQRTEANYFTVDGVSASTGSNPTNTFAAGPSGSLPGETALGTTQSMLSLDAMQEFRATTSTYSAEFGRTPGGQFSLVSRSGTNDWHGSVFDYFRNEALDANNWYSDAAGLGKTPERQNDFGGTLGGPVRIPGFYNGRDRTFFFFSYEGLRLQQPAGAVTDQYPDAAMRTNAPPALQPFLNAFPPPNGPEVLDAMGNQTGLALFSRAYSNPSSLDAVSIRVDHNLNSNMKIFGRYGGSPSSTTVRDAGSNLAESIVTDVDVKTLTVGVTNLLSPRLNNDFRFNYTRNDQTASQTLDGFGGAKPFELTQVPGFSGGSVGSFSQFNFILAFGAGPSVHRSLVQNAQQQWNITDAFSVSRGSHNLKFGMDHRRLSTILHSRQIFESGVFLSKNDVMQNTPLVAVAGSDAPTPPQPIYTNLSLYAQDDWKMAPRVSLSFGLRWDLNPAPRNDNGVSPYTLDQIANLNTAQLAPAGTPLWQTDYHAFAPRVGVAYVPRQTLGTETVVRGGFGIFYDMGNAPASEGFGGVGFAAVKVYFGVPYPLTSAQLVLPPASVAAPYNNEVFAFDPHLRLPYTIHWNFAVEQALGRNQALTFTYLGSVGRRLLFSRTLFPPTNSNFSSGNGLQLTTGAATSDYHALQVQFQKKLSHGLQSMASYTWAHAIDSGSSNFFTDQLLRGNSNFDVRHNLEAALTYDIPVGSPNRALSAIVKHWGLDARISARSGFPVDVLGSNFILPNGQVVRLRPNLVTGVPVYLFGSQYPGGRILNFNAFQPAPNNTQGDLPRNFVRDFRAIQADLALRREFPIEGRFRLQFRAEAFNLFNHPNFSNINNILSAGPYDPTTRSGFGVARSTLNNSLGGLSALYQVGGPRSLQLALKLQF